MGCPRGEWRCEGTTQLVRVKRNEQHRTFEWENVNVAGRHFLNVLIADQMSSALRPLNLANMWPNCD